jgi:hypothetical protein
MRTEATPTSIAEMIMDSVSAKHNGGDSAPSPQLVPKLCPKYVRNIKTHPKISNSIEIQNAPRTTCFPRIHTIICALRFSVASTTRVKSEVQVLYRPHFL